MLDTKHGIGDAFQQIGRMAGKSGGKIAEQQQSESSPCGRNLAQCSPGCKSLLLPRGRADNLALLAYSLF
jgi:hypothetical protein